MTPLSMAPAPGSVAVVDARLRPQPVEVPPNACRLYLVRHGTTTMNVENRYRGRRDIPLDAQGYQDAVDAAKLLSGVRTVRRLHRSAASHHRHRPDHRRRRECPIYESCTA